jgi:hypothetical protein
MGSCLPFLSVYWDHEPEWISDVRFEISEEEEEKRRFMGGFLSFRIRSPAMNQWKGWGACRIQFCDTADYKSALRGNGSWEVLEGLVQLGLGVGEGVVLDEGFELGPGVFVEQGAEGGLVCFDEVDGAGVEFGKEAD